MSADCCSSLRKKQLMRPFKKKPRVQPFQKTRQEYRRSDVHEVPNPIGTETVCPLCCYILAPGTVSADYPICPDCSSEGIDFDVVPLADFLDRTTVDKLNDSLRRWESLDGFLPAYKELKSERIRYLISLKQA